MQVEPGEGGQVPKPFRQRGQLVACQVELSEGGEVLQRFRQRGQLVAVQVERGESGEVPYRFWQRGDRGCCSYRCRSYRAGSAPRTCQWSGVPIMTRQEPAPTLKLASRPGLPGAPCRWHPRCS